MYRFNYAQASWGAKSNRVKVGLVHTAVAASQEFQLEAQDCLQLVLQPMLGLLDDTSRYTPPPHPVCTCQ